LLYLFFFLGFAFAAKKKEVIFVKIVFLLLKFLNINTVSVKILKESGREENVKGVPPENSMAFILLPPTKIV